MQNSNPLIIQGDRSLLLDVHAPLADECRAALIPFAELERSPEHLHTYRLTPLSLWNAASAGFSSADAVAVLKRFARFDIPQSVIMWIEETSSRFGKLRLIPDTLQDDSLEDENFLDAEAIFEGENSSANNTSKPKLKAETLLLVTDSLLAFREINAHKTLQKYVTPVADTQKENNLYAFRLLLTDRGTIKQELIKLLWPIKDEVPLKDGEPLILKLRKTTLKGKELVIRDYQKKATEALLGNGGPGTGYGTIVLPCGAGKTVVGMVLMEHLQTSTLIISTNISAVHQWIDELLDKTDLTRDQIGEYTGEKKEIKPVTIATYQILTWRPEKEGAFPHFQLFRERNWGFIIYDEVHLLPAPVFRVTAEIQAIRRVGLTATLVREDGCESHVFSLVGPKRYDVPWKELESAGWIAQSECIEVRLDLDEEKELEYALAGLRKKHRIASENPAKVSVVKALVERFTQDKILVIGQYLDQLFEIAQLLKTPIITGKTPNAERDVIYGDFRSGKIKVLVVSKVANFAIDLPDASIAIQISGTFGSRQEEAQRLGRILRPKKRTARFITLITRNTEEDIFGANRQKFLAEQGYSYRMVRTIDEIPDFLQDQSTVCENESNTTERKKEGRMND